MQAMGARYWQGALHLEVATLPYLMASKTTKGLKH
ncbi:hypothetical protein HCH_05729 [Hahella chejuensis KCTC 2396]|uniref:Uncharacterized protein n=1 Tax=Hahella chejuensis (strain KCTC 2396) TaxID=349521 RepID=Q2SAE2_HAHCH|nr:hypothetical protein HCH_05729 [Hahella chejuensis KCTC 2396]